MKCHRFGAECLSYIRIRCAGATTDAGASVRLFRPFGAGQPRRLSLRGLSPETPPDQGEGDPYQQERKQAGEAGKANQLAEIEGGVPAIRFGLQQHRFVIRGETSSPESRPG